MNKEAVQRQHLQRDDADLVREFIDGDNQAFNRLVLMYEKKVFNLCYRFLGDYDDANDAAQETFVKVYRSAKKFRMNSA